MRKMNCTQIIMTILNILETLRLKGYVFRVKRPYDMIG